MSDAMPGRAELIISGRVATLGGEVGYGWQQGVAIAGGRVIAVGEPRDLSDLAGPSTVEWRLRDDEMAMPGIVDAHLHLMNLVLSESQVDLTGLTLSAALDAIAERHAALVGRGDTDGWLLGHGWSVHELGAWPDAAMLEAVAPRRAVALYAHDHHSRWVSREALRRAGIDARTDDPAGGLVRRTPDGEPTGMLHETASAMVDPFIRDPSTEELVAALARVAGRLAELGITGCHDPGELTGESSIRRGPVFYRSLAERDALPLRVHASVRGPQLERAIELGLRSGQRVGRYTMGWVKLFADGALGSRSALMLEPYTDADVNPPTGGPRGMALASRGELADLLRRAASAGMVGQVHAIGDAAARTVLDVLAQTPSAAQERAAELMPRVEHAQLIHPADQPRFGALGIAASVQPVHLRSDARPARAAWGDRADYAFPLRGLLAGGALIPFGTDAPVEPPDPWPGIAVAVARRDPSDEDAHPLGADQAIALDRAIRAACLDPALVAGAGDAGRLLPGYVADIIVVPTEGWGDSPDPRLLAQTRPLATLIDGSLAHATDRFRF